MVVDSAATTPIANTTTLVTTGGNATTPLEHLDQVSGQSYLAKRL
jgi:hypothetical protein